MTYSGIIKDPNAGFFPRGTYLGRLVAFTLVAAAMGWAFTVFMPQLPDLGWRAGLGLVMALTLVLLTVHVGDTRGLRIFAALFFGAGFAVGMWGLWINAEFGTLPTIDQLRTRFAQTSYTVQTFGEPFQVRSMVFELWAAITLLFASVPLLASLAKPRPAGTNENPFDIHPDFADSFGSRLIFMPLVSFAIAAAAVYLTPQALGYGVPLQLAVLPPLVAGLFYTKLHIAFPKALIISIVGGIAGAAGFWLPWLYMTQGQDNMIAYFQGAPLEILARVQDSAAGYSYVTEIAGYVSDYSPWTFEIWVGLTATYLGLPILVTLCRRFLYFVRIA